MNTAQNWGAKPPGPMIPLSGLPWNLVLDSPSHLSSMRITWGTHPLQLRGPSPHRPHTTAPTQPVEAEAAFPGVPGPVFRPQTCLEPERPYVPLHSVSLWEPEAHETRPPGLSPVPPGLSHVLVWDPPQLCPWCGLSLRGVLILGDTWQVKQAGGSRQVLALS